MIVHVTTRSGAHYTLNQIEMTWRRDHSTIDLHWVTPGLHVPHGTLADWPAIIIGRQLMFDDVIQGMIVTTPVIKITLDVPFESPGHGLDPWDPARF